MASVRALMVQRGLERASPIQRLIRRRQLTPDHDPQDLEHVGAQLRRQIEATARRARVPSSVRLHIERHGPVPGEWIAHRSADPDRLLLYLHGGGYFFGSPRTHRLLACELSARTRARVFLPEYRLAPEHRFPAALDDVLETFTWLVGRMGFAPDDIAVGGDSAGGGLSLALMLRLRDGGLPLPGCYVGISPWLDLTNSGESMVDNAARDWMIPAGFMPAIARSYAGETALDHPYVSPLFGVFEGLPPMLVQVGGAEVLRDDAHRVVERARAANVDASVAEFPGLWHVFQVTPGVPEARAAVAEIGGFVRRHTVAAPK